MRLFLAVAAAQSVGLFLNHYSEAFAPLSLSTTTTTTRRPTSPSLSLKNSDWDNDDFLNSLKGNNPEANDNGSDDDDDFLNSLKGNNPGAKGNGSDDDLPTDSIMDGAELTDEMRQKMRNKDDASGGGTRFKELMAAAQKNPEADGPKSLKNPFVDNPYAGIEGLDPELGDITTSSNAGNTAGTTAGAGGNINPEDMTVEQQAEMFRAMMAGQAPPVPQPPPQQQEQLTGFNPPPKPDRKTGRNRDADAIQNTADIYFAQLKRDSTVRGIARIRGDDNVANSVFEDERIKELEDMISENPHLAGKREEEQQLIDKATEVMLKFQKANEPRHGNPKSSGVSYKQKLEQMKNKRGGGGGAAAAAPASPASSAATSPPKEPEAHPEEPKAVEKPAAKPAAVAKSVEAAKPVAKPAAAEKPSASAFAAVDNPLPETRFAKPVPTAPVAAKTAKASQPPPPPPPPAAAAPPRPQQSTPLPPRVTAASSDDETRKSIRTLMGLILKHRGGTGFGAGGLKGNDIEAYEQLMEDISALLKEEAMANVGTEAPPPISQAEPAHGAVASSDLSQVGSILVALDGSILMYRNSPPELKESVLMTIRSALLSAVNTCNKVMDQDEGIPLNPASAGSQVDSMLACVEGAILMYRNSPPELQFGVLTTLRAALLSAVNTCNRIIADGDVDNFQQYQEATAGMDKPASTGKPAQFYDVQVQSGEPAASAPSGNDENSQRLESIYNTLQSATGNGKMGLRDDLTSEEASELADGIAEMRGIMLDELENGIPAGTGAGPPASSDSPSSMSRYQKMLAQAKAEKADGS